MNLDTAASTPDEGKALGRKIARAVTPNRVGSGGVIITKNGRRWDPALHPRDAQGRFIETGGTAKVWGTNRQGKVVRTVGRGRVEVQFPDGTRETFLGNRLTMVARPDGTRPTTDQDKVAAEDERREKDPKRGNGVDTDDLGDRDKDGVPDRVDANPDDATNTRRVPERDVPPAKDKPQSLPPKRKAPQDRLDELNKRVEDERYKHMDFDGFARDWRNAGDDDAKHRALDELEAKLDRQDAKDGVRKPGDTSDEDGRTRRLDAVEAYHRENGDDDGNAPTLGLKIEHAREAIAKGDPRAEDLVRQAEQDQRRVTSLRKRNQEVRARNHRAAQLDKAIADEGIDGPDADRIEALVDAARAAQDRGEDDVATRYLDDAEIAYRNRGTANRSQDNVDTEPVSTPAPNQQESTDDSAAVRGDRQAVLGDVPADAGRDGAGAGEGEVLPAAGSDGAEGRGGDAGQPGPRDGADDGRGAADGAAADGAAAGRGDRAGRARVPAEGARNRGPRAARGAAAGGRRDGVAPTRFTPASQADLAPKGERAKLNANMEALRTLRRIQDEDRAATPEEQRALARWAGWGALANVFDENRTEFAAEREELRGLIPADEWAKARENTLNAHYTDTAYIDPVWDALRDLGFSGGDVLEPGSGSGNFIGRAPADARMVGVEIEPTTAALSQALYPDATIRAEGFEETDLPDDTFDAVVGNVPFGKYVLHDKKHNASRHTVHNHFIKKALDLAKPGAVVALHTSRYTLDGNTPKNRKARQEMYAQADLLGAVRLPAGAHEQAAGTSVVTDLLVFRKRKPGEKPGDKAWLDAPEQTLADGSTQRVSGYYAAHPENVLGELKSGRGMFTDNELTVVGDKHAGPALAAALDRITADAKAKGLTADTDASDDVDLSAPTKGPGRRTEGHIAEGDTTYTRTTTHGANGKPLAKPRTETTTFTQIIGGREEPYYVPATQADELRQIIGLADTFNALIDAEAATSTDTPEIAALRKKLNAQHDAYTKKYGALNRFTFAKEKEKPAAEANEDGDVDDDESTKEPRRIYPQQGGARTNPYLQAAFALEGDYTPSPDGKTGTAPKADVFTKRTVAKRDLPETADTPEDALSLVMEATGRVDVDEVARMTGQTREEVLAALRGRVFTDPATGTVVPRAEYLSGNVRAKLKAAREAAETNPVYTENVEALELVVPREKGPAEIRVQLGAPWIDASIVQDFANDLLGVSAYGPQVSVDNPGGSTWTVRGGIRGGALPTRTWGTGRRPFQDLLQASLTQSPIQVHDKIKGAGPDGKDKQVLNVAETEAAQAKAEEIADRFAEWVWEDPQRARALQEKFNDTFRAHALRSYDGSPMRTYPGMTAEVSLRGHQNDGVTRIVNEPTALLAHVVGAGKTYTMQAGAMELRRLGLANKPAHVIPNHMLGQYTREFKELYPQAKLLAVDSSVLGDANRRRQFLARAASGDWDSIIFTQEAFKSIPLSAENERAYLNKELDRLRAYLAKAQKADGKSQSVKNIEKQIKSAEERIRKLLDKRKDDGGLTFESTGIDYVFVDEAHGYKNLRLVSADRSLAKAGSQKATDLDMKLDYMRGHSESGRVATLATGTPIANSVSEAFVMQRYLRPDLLEDAGIADFDTWLAMFGEKVTSVEMSVDGNSFKPKTRVSKFRNAGELIRMWSVATDVKRADMLKLPRPDLVRNADGERLPSTVAVTRTPTQEAYIKHLGERADAVKAGMVEPEIDNMLKISSDGRKAALDMRLIDDPAFEEKWGPKDTWEESGKITAAADRLAATYDANKDRVYKVDPKSDVDAAETGALQIVFADMGTPKGDGSWSVYDDLKAKLVERGVPAEKVRFIHEAETAQQKADLFEAARQGKIAVLIGSTEKMGTGTNVQNRAIKVMHMDVPWRPADLEQRDGRVIRQGNQNAEVEVERLVTEGTFDAFMWGGVERKAGFIEQIYRGDLDADEIEDIGDAAADAALVKSIASGNPLLIDQAFLGNELRKLTRRKNAHARGVSTSQRAARDLRGMIAKTEDEIVSLEDAKRRVRDVSGDKFQMRVGSSWNAQDHKTRADAGKALRTMARDLLDGYVSPGEGYEQDAGELGGLPVKARTLNVPGSQPLVLFRFPDLPGDVRIGKDELSSESAGLGLVTRLENRVTGIDGMVTKRRADIKRYTAEIANNEAEAARPFRQADEFEVIQARATSLDKALALTGATDPEQVSERETALREYRRATAEHEKMTAANRTRKAPAAETTPRDQVTETVPTDDDTVTVTQDEVAAIVADSPVTAPKAPEQDRLDDVDAPDTTPEAPAAADDTVEKVDPADVPTVNDEPLTPPMVAPEPALLDDTEAPGERSAPTPEVPAVPADAPELNDVPGDGTSSIPGVTDADVDTFTNGACGVLAEELHKRTGWPIVVVADGPDGVVGSVHAGVQAPDGRILDIEGYHDRMTWLDQYAQHVDAYGFDHGDDYDDDLVNVYTLDEMGWPSTMDDSPRNREVKTPENIARARELAEQIVPAATEAPSDAPPRREAVNTEAPAAPQAPDAGGVLGTGKTDADLRAEASWQTMKGVAPGDLVLVFGGLSTQEHARSGGTGGQWRRVADRRRMTQHERMRLQGIDPATRRVPETRASDTIVYADADGNITGTETQWGSRKTLVVKEPAADGAASPEADVAPVDTTRDAAPDAPATASGGDGDGDGPVDTTPTPAADEPEPEVPGDRPVLTAADLRTRVPVRFDLSRDVGEWENDRVTVLDHLGAFGMPVDWYDGLTVSVDSRGLPNGGRSTRAAEYHPGNDTIRVHPDLLHGLLKLDSGETIDPRWALAHEMGHRVSKKLGTDHSDYDTRAKQLAEEEYADTWAAERGFPAPAGMPDHAGRADILAEDLPADTDAPATVDPMAGIERRAPEAIEGERFAPTQQQQDVYDAALSGRDVKVQAKAGAGKTTTLEGLARRIGAAEPDAQIAYVAFNKSVQTEAEKRMPGNTESRTGHSIAFGWAPKWLKDRTKDKTAIRRPDSVAKHLGITTPMTAPGQKPLAPSEQAMAVVRTLDKYASSADPTITADHLPPSVRERLGKPEQDALVRLAQRGWDDVASQDGRLRVSLDHVRKMWALTEPDLSKPGSGLQEPATVLFLDEAQDTPPVLAKVIADQSIRKVIVGDADQAIYGFTGATDYLSGADADIELPLTKSFRFGPRVADIGNRFLSLLGSKGRVEGAGPESVIRMEGIEEPDAILTRSNAGMVGEIVTELENGRVVGVPKNTKRDLLSFIDSAAFLQGKGDAPRDGLHDDLAAYRTWDEVTEAAESGDAPELVSLVNLVKKRGVDELREIIGSIVDPGEGGFAGLTFEERDGRLVAVGNAFSVKDYLKDGGFKWDRDRKEWFATGTPAQQEAKLDAARRAAGADTRTPDVVVSTAHKAKGLEWDAVRIGSDFGGPKVDPDTGEEVMPSAEELRLFYVAVTRAQKELDPGSLAWVYDKTDENGATDGGVEKVDAADVPTVSDEPLEVPAADGDAPDAVEEPEVGLRDVRPTAGQLPGQQMIDVGGGTMDADDVFLDQVYEAPVPEASPDDIEGQQTIDDLLTDGDAPDVAPEAPAGPAMGTRLRTDKAPYTPIKGARGTVFTETVVGPNGTEVTRPLFVVQKRDGVFGVYRPTDGDQAPALASFGTKREAEKWAEREVADPGVHEREDEAAAADAERDAAGGAGDGGDGDAQAADLGDEDGDDEDPEPQQGAAFREVEPTDLPEGMGVDYSPSGATVAIPTADGWIVGRAEHHPITARGRAKWNTQAEVLAHEYVVRGEAEPIRVPAGSKVLSWSRPLGSVHWSHPWDLDRRRLDRDLERAEEAIAAAEHVGYSDPDIDAYRDQRDALRREKELRAEPTEPNRVQFGTRAAGMFDLAAIADAAGEGSTFDLDLMGGRRYEDVSLTAKRVGYKTEVRAIDRDGKTVHTWKSNDPYTPDDAAIVHVRSGHVDVPNEDGSVRRITPDGETDGPTRREREDDLADEVADAIANAGLEDDDDTAPDVVDEPAEQQDDDEAAEEAPAADPTPDATPDPDPAADAPAATDDEDEEFETAEERERIEDEEDSAEARRRGEQGLDPETDAQRERRQRRSRDRRRKASRSRRDKDRGGRDKNGPHGPHMPGLPDMDRPALPGDRAGRDRAGDDAGALPGPGDTTGDPDLPVGGPADRDATPGGIQVEGTGEVASGDGDGVTRPDSDAPTADDTTDAGDEPAVEPAAAADDVVDPDADAVAPHLADYTADELLAELDAVDRAGDTDEVDPVLHAIAENAAPDVDLTAEVESLTPAQVADTDRLIEDLLDGDRTVADATEQAVKGRDKPTRAQMRADLERHNADTIEAFFAQLAGRATTTGGQLSVDDFDLAVGATSRQTFDRGNGVRAVSLGKALDGAPYGEEIAREVFGRTPAELRGEGFKTYRFPGTMDLPTWVKHVDDVYADGKAREDRVEAAGAENRRRDLEDVAESRAAAFAGAGEEFVPLAAHDVLTGDLIVTPGSGEVREVLSADRLGGRTRLVTRTAGRPEVSMVDDTHQVPTSATLGRDVSLSHAPSMTMTDEFIGGLHGEPDADGALPSAFINPAEVLPDGGAGAPYSPDRLAALKGAAVRAELEDGSVAAGVLSGDGPIVRVGDHDVPVADLASVSLLSGRAVVPDLFDANAADVPLGTRVLVGDPGSPRQAGVLIGSLDDGTILLGTDDDDMVELAPDAQVTPMRAHLGPLEPTRSGARPAEWSRTPRGAMFAEAPGAWRAHIVPDTEGGVVYRATADESLGGAEVAGHAPTADIAKREITDALTGAGVAADLLPRDRAADVTNRARPDGAPAEAPAPIGGKGAEWVAVTDLAVGDRVNLHDARDATGAPLPAAGHVLGYPQPVSVPDRLGQSHAMFAVLVGDNADGTGYRQVAFTPMDSVAARAAQQGKAAEDTGQVTDGGEADVFAGRTPDYVPVDGNGRGLFPGAIVADSSANEGIVTAARGQDVTVAWGDSQETDVSSAAVTVVDGGEVRPTGWTHGGRRLAPGSVVTFDGTSRRNVSGGTSTEQVRGTVELINGDDVTVTTPDGVKSVQAGALSVVSSPQAARDAAVLPDAARFGDIEHGAALLLEPVEGDVVDVALPAHARKDLASLGYDVSGVDDPAVAQAASRVLRGAGATREQVTMLSDAIRAQAAGSGDRSSWGRSMRRLADQLDAAVRERDTTPADQQEPVEQPVEQVDVDDVVPGDTVAIPTPDGDMDAVQVVDKGAETWQVQDEDGHRETVPVPDEAHLLPDVAAPVEEPAEPATDRADEVMDATYAQFAATRARVTASTVAEHAAGAVAGTQSIHALREAVGGSLTPDSLDRVLGRIAEATYRDLDAIGLEGPTRERVLTDAHNAGMGALEQTRESILRTINEAEPLPGEPFTATRSRVAQAILAAGAHAGEVQARRGPDTPSEHTAVPAGDQGDLFGGGRTPDAPTGHTSVPTGEQGDLVDYLTGGEVSDLTAEQRARITKALEAVADQHLRAAMAEILAAIPSGPLSNADIANIERQVRKIANRPAPRRTITAARAVSRSRAPKGPLMFRVGYWLTDMVIRLGGAILRALRALVGKASDARAAARAEGRSFRSGARLSAPSGRRAASSGRFGMRPTSGPRYGKLPAADVRARRVNAAPADGFTVDRLGDDGPGRTALAHLESIKATGADLTAGVPDERAFEIARASKAADRAWRDAVAAGGTDDSADLLKKVADDTRRLASEAAARGAEANGEKVLDALRQRRPMGEGDGATLDLTGDAKAVGAVRWAAQFYPTEWIAALAGRKVTVKTGERGEFDPETNTLTVAAIGDRNGLGGAYGANAVHELAHVFETAVPDLGRAQWAYHFDRTSTGRPGHRVRKGTNAEASLDALLPGGGHRAGETVRPDSYAHPYMGREYGGMTHYEVMAMAMEALFAGHGTVDQSMRQLVIGMLADLGRG